ncbi:GM13951 [Drosophila sechellia]|uniref:GM13951 n=1 Tax=Drosophila sechellia TaxID=7238 RepID=B4HUA4_DROSE|nr:GM13951 [Drosophila sechellia]
MAASGTGAPASAALSPLRRRRVQLWSCFLLLLLCLLLARFCCSCHRRLPKEADGCEAQKEMKMKWLTADGRRLTGSV